MVKNLMKSSEYKEVEEAYIRGGVQYYYLRVDKREVEDDMVVCVEEIYDHLPTEQDKADLYVAYLERCKRVSKTNIVAYANGDAVKSYTINDVVGWEDSEARVSIRRAAADKAAAGATSYTLYHGGEGFAMTPAKVDEILAAVEIYASDCYDITEQKKAEVDALVTIQEAEEYDVTSGYPTKPAFTL